ncbi:MAG: hypothetical protein R2875_02540 [Desulfobacterales bacterium]
MASAQITVIAQRLMRRLCGHCKAEDAPEPEILKVLDLEADAFTIYKAVGCEQCSGTGYHGRMGIFEIFQVNDRLIDLILANEPARVLKTAAVEDGMTTLRQAALEKLAAGETSVEEVLRVTMDS